MDAEVLDAIEETGLAAVFWSVHAEDWTRPGEAAITRAILDGLDDGAIALLHDGGGDRSQTVAATRGIIGTLRERGLAPISLAGVGRRPGRLTP